jgi:hypothetical protein
MLAAGARLGFGLPEKDEVEAARELAARLMGCQVASVEAFSEARRRQPAALLVSRQAGRLTGLVATLLLRPEATPRLLSGEFNGLHPAERDLSGPEARASAYYIWGVAAETRTAKWSAMELCKGLRYEALADLVAFMKAATPEGRRAGVERLGFLPIAGAGDDLLCSPAIAREQAA